MAEAPQVLDVFEMAVKEVSQALAVEQQIMMWPVACTETDSSTEITFEDDRDPDATPLRSKTGAGRALGTRGL